MKASRGRKGGCGSAQPAMRLTLGMHCYSLLTTAAGAVDNAAMKKPRKQSAEPISWRVYLLRAKAQSLGSVEARDEADALKKAAELFEIRKTDRWRLSVRRQ